MLKTLALIVGATVAMAPQAQNPDLYYDKINGFSINKPPKNEEWAFKDKGKFNNCKKAIVHVVDELTIEIHAQTPATGYYDLKGSMEKQWTNLASTAAFKNPKRNALKRSKLPRGGAGNVAAYFLDMSFEDGGGKAMELRVWMLIGKRNRYLYTIFMTNEKGHYKKHQKFADYIFASFRSWKIK